MNNDIVKRGGDLEPQVIEGKLVVKKVVRNGKVAVIVSPGYGAGWSTWHSDPESAMFDPKVVEWIENGKQGIPDIGDAFPGGLPEAQIVWISEGTNFRIEEYDGSEWIEYETEQFWNRA